MNTAERIAEVLQYLNTRDRAGTGIPATDQLTLRLAELTEGRRVPVPVFQCIDFVWRPAQQGEYPISVTRADLDNPICGFYETDIIEVRDKLATLGSPRLSVIIPDSEVTDTRPFSFALGLQERQQMVADYKINLPVRLARICDAGGEVMLWSEYCKVYGLTNPYEYTTQGREMIRNKPKYVKSVQSHVKNSRDMFKSRGLNPGYVDSIPYQIIEEKAGWYFAMYAGEGMALRDSQSIPLNLEDSRVPTWFQRGAEGQLPIVTPVNPDDFYNWRKGK